MVTDPIQTKKNKHTNMDGQNLKPVMVTNLYLYKPSSVRIDARNFELSW